MATSQLTYGSLHVQPDADHGRPLAHPGQAKVVLGHESSRFKSAGNAAPIVDDGEPQAVGVLGQAHGDFGNNALSGVGRIRRKVSVNVIKLRNRAVFCTGFYPGTTKK